MYDEYRGYLFGQLGAREGDPAPNWKVQLETLTQLNPPFGKNPAPGVPTPADAPHHGITIMIDGGGNARGRIWLPTDDYVENGGNRWYTHEMQVIADGPSGGIVWAWQDKGGASVRSFSGGAVQPPIQPPVQPPGGAGGLTEEQVQAMIDEALKPVSELLAGCVYFDTTIALQAHGDPGKGREGKYICAEGGGPAANGQTFKLTSRSGVGAWESFKIERGQ